MVTLQKPVAPEAPDLARPLMLDELAIAFPESVVLSDELICEIAVLNESLAFERDEAGRLIVSMGPDFDSNSVGRRIMAQIFAWDPEWLGETLDPSSMLHLPDNNLRMPDTGWLSPATAARARTGERPYPHVVPDFVVEVRSSTQSLPAQQAKMAMWMRNGVALGWLADPQTRTVWVYRPDAEPTEHIDPTELSADPTCEGLQISFEQVW